MLSDGIEGSSKPTVSPEFGELVDEDMLYATILEKLDDYIKLKTECAGAFAKAHIELTKANYVAPPGVKYGQNCYDNRMQATRLVNQSNLSELVKGGDVSTSLKMFGILVPGELRASQTHFTEGLEVALKLNKLLSELATAEEALKRVKRSSQDETTAN